MAYKIRPAKRQELNTMIEWAAKEGWNPGLYDAESFYAVDPQGFFLGFLNNKLIASISAVAYDKKFGFLGFYIVKPDYRGQGYGLKIWNQALKHLPTQNIGIDGVIAQQENYKKSGFKLAYRNIRYEGKGTKAFKNKAEIVLLKNVPFKQVKKYDDQLFPTSRPIFLKYWLKQPESLAIGWLKNSQLLGYGMVRKCQTGYRMGPLFANTESIADALFQKLQSFVGEKTPIFLDIPEVNKNALALVKKHNMRPMFETARMYTKKEPKLPLQKIFGVTTFELG